MVSLCCPLFWPIFLCFFIPLAVQNLYAHRDTPVAAVTRTPTTRRSMATGYLSVSEEYEEGEGLAGSVVVLTACEVLEIDGDVGIVEVLDLDLDLDPGLQLFPCCLGQSRPYASI